MLSDLLFRLRALFRRGAVERELDEELRFHFERQVEKHVAAGATPAEARRQARLAFGGLDQVKEDCRRARGVELVDTGLQDLRYGLRVLGKHPAFTATAVLTLALGIGANTALFSIVNAVLLNALPYPHPERLVRLHESKQNFAAGSISYPNFRDWQKMNRSFSALAVSRGFSYTLVGVGETERIDAQLVSTDFFPLLGVKPLLGRTFAPGEDEIGARPVLLVSEGFWRQKLGSRPQALGQSLTLDGRDFTIVGVIPASFDLRVGAFRASELYVPIGQWGNPFLSLRTAGLGIHCLGRLKPGVTLAQAQADMNAVTRGLAAAYPDANKGIGAKLAPLSDEMVGEVRPVLFVLLGAVGLVLLIACGNVANLLLARATGRARELAIRTALGASRGRVLRQLLTESVLLAVAGGGLGLLVAGWGTKAALAVLPTALPRAGEIAVDGRVLGFTLAVSLLAALLCGLAPALRASRPDSHRTMQEGGRGGLRHRAQEVFVLVEVAMALVLLIGAGLLIRSLAALWSVDPGFRPGGVLTFGLALPPAMKEATPAAIRAHLDEIERRLGALPGVQAMSFWSGAFPLSDDDERLFWKVGQPRPASPNDMSWALAYTVGPGYLKAMGIPLLSGRFFDLHDDEHAPLVAVVDEVFARQYFGQAEPLHQRLNVDDYETPVEIVGVVRHVKQWGLDSDGQQALQAQMYMSFRQVPDSLVVLAPRGSVGVVVHAAGTTRGLFDAIRGLLREMNGQQVVYRPQTMEEIVAATLAARRFSMDLLGVFAALALVLASVGIYGVISYLVGQKTREIGLRVALGARRGDVLGLVLGSGVRMALAGVLVGLVAALSLTRLLASLLYGVSATDPLTFGGVALILTAVALLASYLPARRALRVDPMEALRLE